MFCILNTVLRRQNNIIIKGQYLILDLKEFKDRLINATILDKEVLDSLISKCVLTLDDKEEICSFEDQSSRNNKLLEILMQRPYNTFDMFVEVMKESDQKCHTSLVVNMKAQLTDKDSSSMKEQHNENITGTLFLIN